MQLGQLMKHSKTNIFLQTLCSKWGSQRTFNQQKLPQTCECVFKTMQTYILGSAQQKSAQSLSSFGKHCDPSLHFDLSLLFIFSVIFSEFCFLLIFSTHLNQQTDEWCNYWILVNDLPFHYLQTCGIFFKKCILISLLFSY